MKDESGTLQGILDITPPAVPWQYTLENNATSTIGFCLLLIVALGFLLRLIWQRYFSTRGIAKYRLATLQQQYRRQLINDQHAAFQLCHILCDALEITQLSSRTTLPETMDAYKERWQVFIDTLSIARYSPADSGPEISHLFNDAQFWLRSWPREKHV
jgi:hypothetical protein